MAEGRNAPLRTAVVTGGHGFDVIGLHRLMRRFPEMDVYVQHMDDFAVSPLQVRQSYDVIIFFQMLREGPSDEQQPWYAGKPRSALEALGQSPQGILVLHHGVLAYPQWSWWDELVGITGRTAEAHLDQQFRVQIVDREHPVTRPLSDWEMTDETYTMPEPGPGCHALLSVQHPTSMHTLAWTHVFGQSRVLCCQLGHGGLAWENYHFRELLRRSILWCGRRL